MAQTKRRSLELRGAMTAALVAAAMVSGAAYAQTEPPKPAEQSRPAHGTPQTASPASAAKEDHPKMEAALKALDHARSSLEAADHDFQGHRVKALEAVNRASAEIREGLASDAK
jgi:hypothetical protein